MPKVRANAAERWTRRASAATQDYAAGVAAPRTPWLAATVAAAPAQAAAVQEAIRDRRFERGVQAAGEARWQAKSTGKGAERFGPGVADAQADYQRGVQPYLDTIANLSLPARGPKGDLKNLDRVRVIVQALRAKKLGK